MRGVSAVVALFAIGATGCSSTSTGGSGAGAGGGDCAAACAYLVSCGAAVSAECLAACDGLNFDQACTDAIQKDTCDQLKADTSPSSQVCLPACSPANSAHCLSSAQIDVCSGMAQHSVANCAYVCQLSGKHYTGSCGLTYQGQTADHDVCWCA